MLKSVDVESSNGTRSKETRIDWNGMARSGEEYVDSMAGASVKTFLMSQELKRQYNNLKNFIDLMKPFKGINDNYDAKVNEIDFMLSNTSRHFILTKAMLFGLALCWAIFFILDGRGIAVLLMIIMSPIALMVSAGIAANLQQNKYKRIKEQMSGLYSIYNELIKTMKYYESNEQVSTKSKQERDELKNEAFVRIINENSSSNWIFDSNVKIATSQTDIVNNPILKKVIAFIISLVISYISIHIIFSVFDIGGWTVRKYNLTEVSIFIGVILIYKNILRRVESKFKTVK